MATVMGSGRQRRLVTVGSILLLATASFAGPRRADVARLRGHLTSATEAVQSDDPERAAELYKLVMLETEGWDGPNLLLARAVDGLADVERDQGRVDRAEALYLRAIPMWEQLLGHDQPRLAITLNNLAAIYVDQGRPDEAEPPLRRALDIWVARFGADSERARITKRAYQSLLQAISR